MYRHEWLMVVGYLLLLVLLHAQEFADGETIYHRGEQHPMCFFVHSGVVRLEYSDGSVETKVKTGDCLWP